MMLLRYRKTHMSKRRNDGCGGRRGGKQASSGRPEKGSDYYGVAAVPVVVEASIPVESERSQCKLIKAGGEEGQSFQASQPVS